MKPLEALTCLVVDDEPFTRSMIVRSLRSAGVRVVRNAEGGRTSLEIMADASVSSHRCEPIVLEADSGDDAIGALRASGSNIDCIISDFQMPNGSGLELLKAIRTGRTAAERNLPFAMVTGFAESHILASAMALHVNAFLAKPVSKALLLQRLHRVMTDHSEVGPVEEYAAVPVPDTFPVHQPKAPPPAPRDELPGIHVALDQLRPGNILAVDIMSDQGSIILTAGSVLSQRTINRLYDLHEMGQSLATLRVTG